jgi:hypothetical protein
MKKRIVLSGLLAAALTLSLTACGGDKMPEETPVPTPIQTSTPVPTPTPTPAPAAPKWGDQVFAKTFTSGDGATVLTASFTLPLIQNTDACPAGAAINEWYKAEGASRMLEAEEAYEMAVADYDVSKAAGFPFYPTTQEMTYQIAYADEKVISVCRDLYVSSEGEAHPAVFLLSEQFDAVMGEKLDFTDFFTDADAVRARVVDALLDQRSELATAVEQGTLTRDAITAAVQVDNFYCTAEGYVFWLQGGALPAMNSPLSAVLTYDAMKDVSADG